MPVEGGEAAQRLKLLGCEVQREDGRLRATVPTFRRDLEREADLIEEIGRLVGLENVPERLPGVPQPGGLTSTQKKLRRLRHLLADLGLAEAVTYPFGPGRWYRDLGLQNGDAGQLPLKLRNPLSVEAANLRSTLLPGLLDAAARNRSFGARGGAVFEVGHVFESVEQPEGIREYALRYRLRGETGLDAEVRSDLLTGVEEKEKVAGLLTGTTHPPGWNVPAFTAGFFEAKGLVERIVPSATFEPRSQPFLHPGRAAAVLVAGVEIGWVGELHPDVVERFDLEGWPVAAFELDQGATEPDPTSSFAPFYNVPPVSMDLAVIVGEGVRVGDMLEVIASLHSPILAEVRVFDVYEGSQVPSGKKSVALNFKFQAEETLNDVVVREEIDRISERLHEAFGGQIRSG
jgi:phenylalanyl-tRNA synthetase beta chain